MNNNLEKYKKVLSEISQNLILASNSIANMSDFQNDYSIIPISNHKKGNLQLGIRNMTTGTGFIIRISRTSQSIILLDKNVNSYCEYIRIIYDGKKQTLLRCPDKSSIYEKSKLDESGNYYYSTDIEENYFTKDNQWVNNSYELIIDEEDSHLERFGTNIDLSNNKNRNQILESIEPTLDSYCDLLNNNNVLLSMNSLLKSYYNYMLEFEKKSHPDPDDGNNR